MGGWSLMHAVRPKTIALANAIAPKLMPGDKKFKTKELSSQINSARLSFAEPEDMLKYLDIEPGAIYL